LNAQVVGVSADSVDVQRKFIERFSLTFPMISDTAKEIIGAYGAREILGITAKRSTFLIDPEGRVAAVWPRVKVEGHADDVFATLRRLSGS
jgi:thioredoxin-dependent peroxiredoxin